MKNTVILKGNRYGISIVLDKEIDFETLKNDLMKRLENAEEFFDSDKQLAVTFEGRALTNEELDEILAVIRDNSKLNIQYVMEENSELETTFYDIIQSETEEKDKEIEYDNISTFEEQRDMKLNTATKPMSFPVSENDSAGMFYKGTLRSGQSLEAKDSIIIIGDVNPGATVLAGGNIIIIGALKGTVHAGTKGNKNAFVLAMVMNPMQIQIGEVIARSPDSKKGSILKKEAMVALIIDGQICIEPVSKTSIQDLNI